MWLRSLVFRTRPGRLRLHPFHARARRSAGYALHTSWPESPRPPQTSALSCLRLPGPPIRQSTTGRFVRARSIPFPSYRGSPGLLRRREMLADSCPSLGEVRGAPCGVVDPQAPDIFVNIARRARSKLSGDPGHAFRSAAVAKVLPHALGNQKLRFFRPPVNFLDQPHFFLAQRFSVSGICILLVWR